VGTLVHPPVLALAWGVLLGASPARDAACRALRLGMLPNSPGLSDPGYAGSDF